MGIEEHTKQSLIELIGNPPEGSHPDEWQPRAATWHDERQNWIKEIDRLREHIRKLEDK